jgi:hypothetical protein
MSSAQEIKVAMNKILNTVLKIFYRLSSPVESDFEYFGLSYY